MSKYSTEERRAILEAVDNLSEIEYCIASDPEMIESMERSQVEIELRESRVPSDDSPLPRLECAKPRHRLLPLQALITRRITDNLELERGDTIRVYIGTHQSAGGNRMRSFEAIVVSCNRQGLVETVLVNNNSPDLHRFPWDSAPIDRLQIVRKRRDERQSLNPVNHQVLEFDPQNREGDEDNDLLTDI